MVKTVKEILALIEDYENRSRVIDPKGVCSLNHYDGMITALRVYALPLAKALEGSL
jgi:hypothetical protein